MHFLKNVEGQANAIGIETHVSDWMFKMIFICHNLLLWGVLITNSFHFVYYLKIIK